MSKDYIKWIRDRVGHDLIFLNFAAGILANDDGKILLQKRADKGTWGLVGGALELGESSVDALKREFIEESGIRIAPMRFLNVYTHFQDSYPNGDIAQTIVMLYEVKALGDVDVEGIQNEETLELGFFSKDELNELDIVNDQHRLMIEEYFTENYNLGN